MSTETRSFVLGPTIIRHLIESQAGTLAKAITEAVTNAIDAHATHVDITLRSDGFTVADDGIGMQSREEILRCFEVLGFEHTDRDRQTGLFGLGRAQLWAFAATCWRTATFSLDVDVRGKGEGYELRSGLDPVAGLTIEGQYYEPRTEVEQLSDLKELTTLLKYVAVPIRINGQQVNTPPASQTWSEETPEAYLKTTASASVLKVYSQGVFIREMSAYQVGVGGVVVTKIGHPLALNTARNDILTAKCELWKKLRSRLKAIADDKSKAATERLTDTGRDHYAARLGEPGGAEFVGKELFTLADRRHVSLDGLATRARKAAFLSVSPAGNASAEAAIRNGTAIVLHEATLARFGASSVAGFVANLTNVLTHRPPEACSSSRAVRNIPWDLQTLARLPIYEDFTDSPLQATDDHRIIDQKQLSDGASAVLKALAKTNASATLASLAADRSNGAYGKSRALVVGESKFSEAWTDGRTYIAINHTLLHEASLHTMRAMAKLIIVMLHEYLHDSNTDGSHVHDHDFLEKFHEVTIQHAATISGLIDRVVEAAYTLRKKKAITAAKRLDRIKARASHAESGRSGANDQPLFQPANAA